MSALREPGMWQQFRRRRVIRAVVTYLAVAFALVESTWFLAGYLGLPEPVERVVLGAAVLGFPLAVVLAWTYDLTPDGIVKTPDELGPAGPEEPEAEDPPPGKRFWWLFPAGAAVAGLILQLVRP